MLLRNPVSKVPRENIFEGSGVHQCSSLFKSHLLRAQEQEIQKCHKSSKQGKRPAWLSRDLILELRWKRKVYEHWKQGQVTWEDYRDAIQHCREKICVDKAPLGFKMVNAVKDSKKGF